LYRAYPSAIHVLDSKGRTPLHLASRNILYDLVTRLYQAGVSVDLTDHEGKAALDHVRSRRIAQGFEPRFLLLERNFEKERDAVEEFLAARMRTVP